MHMFLPKGASLASQWSLTSLAFVDVSPLISVLTSTSSLWRIVHLRDNSDDVVILLDGRMFSERMADMKVRSVSCASSDDGEDEVC